MLLFSVCKSYLVPLVYDIKLLSIAFNTFVSFFHYRCLFVLLAVWTNVSHWVWECSGATECLRQHSNDYYVLPITCSGHWWKGFVKTSYPSSLPPLASLFSFFPFSFFLRVGDTAGMFFSIRPAGTHYASHHLCHFQFPAIVYATAVFVLVASPQPLT